MRLFLILMAITLAIVAVPTVAIIDLSAQQPPHPIQPDPITVKEIADTCAAQVSAQMTEEISRRIVLETDNKQLKSVNAKQDKRIKELEAMLLPKPSN